MILVDGAIWAWRDRRWAHLVSDRDYRELHAFAAELGLARVAFQGDHYDVDEATRLAALAAGATAVDSRELLRRLRSAGLRRPAAYRPWRWQVVAEWPLPGVERVSAWPPEADPLLAAGMAAWAQAWAAADGAGDEVLRVMARLGERAAVVVDLRRVPSPPVAELVVELTVGAGGEGAVEGAVEPTENGEAWSVWPVR